MRSRGKLLLAGLPVVALLAGCLPPGTPPTFNPGTVLSYPTATTTSAGSVGIGDVTGDGRSDLVVAAGPNGNGHVGGLVVYPQTSSGTLGEPVTLPSSAPYGSPDHVVLADVNRDGHLDAVVADLHLEIYLQQAGRLVRSRVLPWVASDVQVADVNRDGLPDLVTMERSTADYGYAWAVHVHVQQPDGTFAAGYVVGSPIDLDNPWPKVTIADLDGDGRPDIVAMIQYGFWVARQSPTGTFGKPVTYLNVDHTPGNAAQMDMAVGDINGDGRPDVITERTANYPYGDLEVFTGQPGGIFSAPKLMPADEGPDTLAVADVTGDGRNDIIASISAYSRIGVYAQRTDGTLSPISLTGTRHAPACERCIAVGDLNGDHLMDLAMVIGAPTDKPVQVLYQHP